MGLAQRLLRIEWVRFVRNRLRGVPAEVLLKAGSDFYCGRGAYFRRFENVRIGNHVYMGINVHIACPCLIKDDAMLANYVSLVGGDHRFDQPGVLMNGSGRGEMKDIVIEEDAWIGQGVILLSGVRIGRGAIVAAGSVVTKDVPPCTIWGSNPAHFLRNRFASEEEQRTHLSFLEQRYGPREL